MQWPTFACQLAHCPPWLTVGTSLHGVALGGCRAGRGQGGGFGSQGPGLPGRIMSARGPALDTSLELICLAVGSVCKLHRPFAAPLCPLAWPSKGSRPQLNDSRLICGSLCHTGRSQPWHWGHRGTDKQESGGGLAESVCVTEYKSSHCCSVLWKTSVKTIYIFFIPKTNFIKQQINLKPSHHQRQVFIVNNRFYQYTW